MLRLSASSLRTLLAALLLAIAAACASTASAHAMPGLNVSKAPPVRTSFDRQEVASLGTQHAAEHRLIRAEQRWIRHLSKRQLKRLMASNLRVYKAALKLAAPANVDGSWEAPFRIPNYAMHAALMPTGKVLFYGWPKDYSDPTYGGSGTRDARNFGTAWLWDPTAGTGAGAFKDVPPPISDVNGGGAIDDNPTLPGVQTDVASLETRPAPIYCSGFAWLGNGTLVVMGGNRVLIPNEEGTRLVFTFDPFTETWHRQQSMEQGRWYPSVVELPDGRVATFSGWTENGNALKDPVNHPNGQMNTDIDVFPTTGVQYGSAGRAAENLPVSKVGTLDTEYYPHTRLLNNGRISVTGPGGQPYLSGALTDLNTWATLPYLPANNGAGNTLASAARGGGNAVLLPNGTLGPDTVMLLGGYYYATTAANNYGATAAIKITPGTGAGVAWTDRKSVV